MAAPIVAMLTDFGSQDAYVAIMKGVIWRVSDSIKLIDITHSIPLGKIRKAAFILESCIGWFPEGTVFLAVVDPGVGGERKAVAIRGEKYFYVGPDNGIFTLALKRDPLKQAVEISAETDKEQEISSTFHGRDLFAPAAAKLALGEALHTLGSEVKELVELDGLNNSFSASLGRGSILCADSFGNLITSLHIREMQKEVVAAVTKGYRFPMCKTYSEVEEGGCLAYWGSSGYCELAVNKSSAANLTQALEGDTVLFELK
ncbi:MAG: S-adenosyl-l-methionine hydroxide adenosyltransferase family protein [Candidatus Bruticola sp.]